MDAMKKSYCSWGWVFAFFSILSLLFQVGCKSSSPGPLEWLESQPFTSPPADMAPVISTNLPEGFIALEPNFVSEDLSDATGYVTTVVYQAQEIGIDVQVAIMGFSTLEARNNFIDSLNAQAITVEFVDIAGTQIVRYHASGLEGRVWISNPWIVAVSSQGITALGSQWVSAFAEMYLAQYPSAGME